VLVVDAFTGDSIRFISLLQSVALYLHHLSGTACSPFTLQHVPRFETCARSAAQHSPRGYALSDGDDDAEPTGRLGLDPCDDPHRGRELGQFCRINERRRNLWRDDYSSVVSVCGNATCAQGGATSDGLVASRVGERTRGKESMEIAAELLRSPYAKVFSKPEPCRKDVNFFVCG